MNKAFPSANESDHELERIVGEEERVLARVQKHIAARLNQGGSSEQDIRDYDAELISLRNQISEARLEDVPPLIEEMERVSEIAARRGKWVRGSVDPSSPYFGRMVLQEGERLREVLIGKTTYLDLKSRISIVDWRNAPVSRIYYKYEEGEEYDELIGDREVQGEVLVRRALWIRDGTLRRINARQGVFVRTSDGWRRAGLFTRLKGGQGVAMRAEDHHAPGKLGVGASDEREEKYLPEITALIDPRQFELITRPDTGIVIIQGGAGSGKTTIGLHRMAYLAFQNPEKYRPERMLVLVYNDALVRYISRVLPSLGVHGVPVLTFERWAEKLRKSHLPATPSLYADDTPSSVTRLKKHPKMLDAIEEYCEEVSAQIESHLSANLSGIKGAEEAMAFWRANPKAPPALRLHRLLRWASEGEAARIPMLRHGIERTIAYARRELLDVVVAWANILTDRQRLERFFAQDPDIDSHDLSIALRHASERCGQVLNEVERIEEEEESDDRRKARKSKSPDSELSWGDTEEEIFDDDPSVGVDGVQEEEPARLDREDDALFLRIIQRLRGPLLHSPGKQSEVLRYEHIFVDEVQDLSPVELAVVLGTATKQRSVTMAGDAAQRLHMDNGFKNWAELLRAIDPRRIGEESAPIEIEPLRVQYRSTHQIIALAQAVLGPLADPNAGHAIREGVPVELFVFSHSGEAVAHLAQALRELMQLEPRASVCLIARYPEQADIYYRGLLSAEVPHLRRIADQDFPFRAGIDVTDVRQVKGLEFDYVVLLECSSASYPVNDESRHLLHIAITRAAHQLWITTTGEPSLLLPESLRQGAY